jgi:hypothetical protein
MITKSSAFQPYSVSKVESSSNGNETQNIPGGKIWPGSNAGNLIYEIRLSRKCRILDVSQFCGPPWPVARITVISLTCEKSFFAFYKLLAVKMNIHCITAVFVIEFV